MVFCDVEWICNLMCIIRSYLGLKTCQHSENTLTAYAEYVTPEFPFAPKRTQQREKNSAAMTEYGNAAVPL